MQKNNKLIAEFMGAEWHKDFFKDVCIVSPSNMSYKFHTSWDWLMPVINKCYQEHMSKHIADAVMTCDIDEAYQVALEFIKEYNEKN